MNIFDPGNARVHAFVTRDSNHFGRDIQGEHLPSKSLEVNCVLAGTTSQVKNAITAPDERIELTPHGIALQSAGI